MYEASRLAFEGEDVLEEAFMFTRKHLTDLQGNLEIKGSSEVQVKVSHALELPLHRRMLRLEARWYIEAYGDQRAAEKRTLLELAKLDFNMVQSKLQDDLKDMSR